MFGRCLILKVGIISNFSIISNKIDWLQLIKSIRLMAYKLFYPPFNDLSFNQSNGLFEGGLYKVGEGVAIRGFAVRAHAHQPPPHTNRDNIVLL